MNGEVTIRPAVRSDATEVAALLASQRQHLAPWDPRREPAFFTRGGQRARLSQVERDRDCRHLVPLPDPRRRRACGRGLDHEHRAPLVPERQRRLLGGRRALRPRVSPRERSRRPARSRSASSSCIASRPGRCCTTWRRRSCSTATDSSRSESPPTTCASPARGATTCSSSAPATTVRSPLGAQALARRITLLADPQ